MLYPTAAKSIPDWKCIPHSTILTIMIRQGPKLDVHDAGMLRHMQLHSYQDV
jgi:hypothetical protein